MGQINDYTAETAILDTDQFVLQKTAGGLTKKSLWSLMKSTLKTYFDTLYSTGEPVGTIKTWDKTFPGTPALLSNFVECDGELIDDGDSVYDGYRSRNLNGADVVLTLTWTADAGGSYSTIAATDLTALAVGDDVTGSGIAASSYISDITGTTVTITDVSATGSISSTFTNDGDFIKGGSASNVGQKDHMQQITGGSGAGNGNYQLGALTGALSGGSTTHTYAGSNANAGAFPNVNFDSANSPNARTDTTTYPKNRTMVYIMKIK